MPITLQVDFRSEAACERPLIVLTIPFLRLPHFGARTMVLSIICTSQPIGCGGRPAAAFVEESASKRLDFASKSVN